MLKGLFIIAQVNLRAVTGSYGTKGHALQQLEVHDYGPRPLKRLACKVYDRAREEGGVAADGSI